MGLGGQQLQFASAFSSAVHTHTHSASPARFSHLAPHTKGCSALGPQHKKDVDLLEQEAMKTLRGWRALLRGQAESYGVQTLGRPHCSLMWPAGTLCQGVW